MTKRPQNVVSFFLSLPPPLSQCTDGDLLRRLSGLRQHPLTGRVFQREQWDPEKKEPKKRQRDPDQEQEEEEDEEEEEEQVEETNEVCVCVFAREG